MYKYILNENRLVYMVSREGGRGGGCLKKGEGGEGGGTAFH